jgi:hypothetical protein
VLICVTPYSLVHIYQNFRATGCLNSKKKKTVKAAGSAETLVTREAGRSQRPRGLRPVSARLLGLRVRIPPEAWLSVACECCVLSGRGLCVMPITSPEESYRVWCVSLCVVTCNNNPLHLP